MVIKVFDSATKDVKLVKHAKKEHKRYDYCIPLGHDFWHPDHSLKDIIVLFLKGNLKNTQKRKTFELYMIILFDTRNSNLH